MKSLRDITHYGCMGKQKAQYDSREACVGFALKSVMSSQAGVGQRRKSLVSVEFACTSRYCK
jgi:hypothetical protein